MDHTYNFNNVNPLNVWELEMLQRIKKIISNKQFARITKEREAKEAFTIWCFVKIKDLQQSKHKHLLVL